MQVQFATESAESRSLPLSAQRVINLFTEKQQQGAKSPTPLFGVPGLTSFVTCGTGPIRGLWVMQGILYAVSGAELYSITRGAVVTLLGGGIGGTGNVSMSDNGVQLGIVNGQQGYIYTLATNLFVQIASDGFNPADTIFFFDGYFVLNHSGTNQFFISALYDGTSYDPLDFASAEASPDFVVACVQNLQLLFIICVDHIELWYDAGTEDFPFQRFAGGVINYGCNAPASVILQDGAIFFLGTDKVFYRLQGNVPYRISTHPIEHILAQDPDLTTASCMTYTIEGHKMVALTLPNSARTLEYDISTGLWHERESTIKNVSIGRWRGNCSAQAYGQTYIGDAVTGDVSLLDWDVYTELGNQIIGTAYSIPYHEDRKRVFIPRFELDVESGVGLAAGQGSDPQIFLQWSKDGARTFSDTQPWRSMGKIGEYQKRLRWLRLGQSRQWIFKISMSDPVRRTIIAANMDIEVGM